MAEAKPKHFKYLESLRLSGDTNMFGAAPYLMREFRMGSKQALRVLQAWMDSHKEK